MIPLWTLILLIAGYLVYQRFFEKTKTGYVLVQDIYNHFELKRDMQSVFEKSHNARKKVLDSLIADIKIIGRKINNDKVKDTAAIRLFNIKREQYFETRQRLNQDDSAQLKQADEQILGQLNQYIKDYASKNHYKYIFGNASGGALMAADTTLNITSQLTEYVNQRYENKK